MFKHDRSKARKEGRCLACGQTGHYRPECTLVSPENRVVQESGSDASPPSNAGVPAKAAVKAKAKAKAGAQVKGVVEELKNEGPGASGSAPSGGVSASVGPEALVAEAAKL